MNRDNFFKELDRRQKAGLGAVWIVTRDLVACRLDLLKNKFGIMEESDGYTSEQILGTVRACREKEDFTVVVSRKEIPEDLADEISTLRYPLPDIEFTKQLIADQDKRVTFKVDEAAATLQGLTSSKQADALALAIVDALERDDDLADLSVLRRYKENELGKLSYLRVSEPTKSFASLVGHDSLKTWLQNRKRGFTNTELATPKGMLLVGPPGTGKSRFAEATAKEWGVPFMTLDVASIFTSYLGESEANMQNAIEVAERLAPCVVLVDEVERVFGGGDRDGGTSQRIIGKFLTWLANKTSPVFVVFTSNNASILPAALIRKGRLDEIFALTVPSIEERKSILEHYLGGELKKHVDAFAEKTRKWSPAEIEAVISAARYADKNGKATEKAVLEEIKKTVPVSISMQEQVSDMAEWAERFARPTG